MDINCNHAAPPAGHSEAERKPRVIGDGAPGPLTQLKALPDAEHDFLLLRRGEVSQRCLIGEIESRYGIQRLAPPRLSEFFSWLAKRRTLLRIREGAVAFREKFVLSNPDATLEEAREATVLFLCLEAVREDYSALKPLVPDGIRRPRTRAEAAAKFEAMERRIAALEEYFEAILSRAEKRRRNHLVPGRN